MVSVLFLVISLGLALVSLVPYSMFYWYDGTNGDDEWGGLQGHNIYTWFYGNWLFGSQNVNWYLDIHRYNDKKNYLA